MIAGGKATTSKPSGPPRPPPAIGEAYAWSGDRLIEAAPLYADGSIAWDQATAWAYAPDQYTPLAQMRNGQLWYIVSDHIGAPRELLTERGEVAWSNRPEPWGQASLWTTPAANDDVDCPLRFPGQYYDPESGLHYNRHRYYDPETAQYLSPDPLGLAGGIRPQSYVENPNTWIDPLGLASYPPNNNGQGNGLRDPTRFIDGVTVTDRRTGQVLQGTVDLKPTLDRINSGGSFPHRNDGSTFHNRAGDLPVRPTGYYTEYVHPTPSIPGPGPQRIVTGGGGEMYYTPNHYTTFIPIN